MRPIFRPVALPATSISHKGAIELAGFAPIPESAPMLLSLCRPLRESRPQYPACDLDSDFRPNEARSLTQQHCESARGGGFQTISREGKRNDKNSESRRIWQVSLYVGIWRGPGPVRPRLLWRTVSRLKSPAVQAGAGTGRSVFAFPGQTRSRSENVVVVTSRRRCLLPG